MGQLVRLEEELQWKQKTFALPATEGDVSPHSALRITVLFTESLVRPLID